MSSTCVPARPVDGGIESPILAVAARLRPNSEAMEPGLIPAFAEKLAELTIPRGITTGGGGPDVLIGPIADETGVSRTGTTEPFTPVTPPSILVIWMV